MKFQIEKNYAVLKIEEKKNADLYSLIDLDSGDKITSIGVKSDEKIKPLEIVSITLSLVVKTERVETKDKGFKYFNVANTFVSEVKKVRSDD